MKHFYYLLFFLALTDISYSQKLVQKFDGISVDIGGGEISPAPFNGGINNARYQFVDIDADNDFDLFMFDADTSLYFYQNTGTPQVASYRLISNRYQGMSFRNWFYFTDIDNDNDKDLFTGGENQTVKYYRNDGTAGNALFNLIIPEVHTYSDTVIYSEANCVPIFCDIDNDGDKDFFTGQSLGTITFYENIGTAQNFSLKYITDFWQNLIIISPALKQSNKEAADNNRHGANSLEFADIDNDNDFDLFWGDLFSKGIYFIRNDGTPTHPNVVIADSAYPSNSQFISEGYNSVRWIDIDADGDKDMFVSVLYLSQSDKNFVFYRNDGSVSNPNLNRITDNYLKCLDMSGNSFPVFTDIDNDGDKDLFVGSLYSKITYFKNTGTSQSPVFVLNIDSLPILSESFNYSPAFADLDNDGDKDLMLGSYLKDSLWFFRNTGNASNFNFTLEGRGHQIGINLLGQSSSPVLADTDNDGDMDLYIGATNGRLFFYENTGTAANFIFTYRTNFYDSIDVGTQSIPKFCDIDGDADLDLFIGEEYGKISYYKNNGSVSNPDFVLQTNNYKDINVVQNAVPEFVDINNDTDQDLFIGNVKGGIYFFRNDDNVSVQNISNVIATEYKLYQNYPNPFNPSTKIKFELPSSSKVELAVFNSLGQKVAILVSQSLSAGSYEADFNTSQTNLSSGVYYYKLKTDNFSEVKKMILLK